MSILRNLFSPPKFDDPETNRQAALLHSILLFSLLVTIGLIISLPFTTANPGPGMVVLGSIIFIFIFLYYFFRRGYVNRVANALIFITWAITAISSFYFGGILNSSYVSLLLLVVAAGLLSNARLANIYAGLSILVGIVLVYFENTGILPEAASPFTATGFLGGMITNILLLTYITNLTTRHLNDALRAAEDNSSAFQEANKELIEIQARQEQEIVERTRQIERRNQYLEAAAQVARDATSQQNQTQLLQASVNLIQEKFNFYHVGIFLIDDNNEYALLEAASSVGGQKMIARGHKLLVGKQGIVGYVTGIGQPRVSQAIELDRLHSTTAELPETRSEMALPLKARGEIIGALDIQSSEGNAFTEDDVQILQTLADQIALALNNAVLYEQAQSSIEEVQRAYGQYSQEAWLDAKNRGILSNYRYTDTSQESARLDAGQVPEVNAEGKVEVPIRVRGKQIGSIEIAKDQSSTQWTEEELDLLENISDQLGVALDSARLFDESQQRATREQMISQVSARVRDTLDLDEVLRIAAEQVRLSMGLPEVTVRLAQQPQITPSNGKISSNGNGSDPAI